MKKVFIIGTGAQGGTIAKYLNELPGVGEIVCADYDSKAAVRLEKELTKAIAVQVDARDSAAVFELAQGADLLVNGLPPEFNMTVMKAALRGKMHYQDMASGPIPGYDLIEAVERQLALDEEFKAIGKAALINTGSAPGLVNVVARDAADKLDAVESIEVMIYSGTWTKRFIPFWWSPETAFGDMIGEPIVYKDGELQKVAPFNNPEVIDFRGLGPRRLTDHEHEEPVTFSKFFKGLSYCNMKYGGPATALAESLYRFGLLGTEPVEVDGVPVVPLRLVCKLTPPAPADPAEIEEVIKEGVLTEEGQMLIRVEGQTEGHRVRIDNYTNSLSLTRAFEKHRISHQSFLTGQSAFMFSRLFVEDRIEETGVFPPEVLDKPTRDYYLAELAKIGITVDQILETRLF